MKKLRDIAIAMIMSGSLGFAWLQLSYYARANEASDPDAILGLAYLAITAILGLGTILFGRVFSPRRQKLSEETVSIMVVVNSLILSVFGTLEGSYEPQDLWPVMFIIILICSIALNAMFIWIFSGDHLFDH